MNQRRIPGMFAVVAALAAVGCSSNSGPGDDAEPVISSGQVILGEDGEVRPSGDDTRSTAARYRIPPGHLPPPGQCRVWMPGEPPGQQKKKYPVGRCSTLRATIPPGAWLVYRPTNDKKEIHVWQYGARHEVLSQRIYDAVTGELIRHVAPASGG